MLVEDVLRLCDHKATGAGELDDLLKATPAALESSARWKRKRVWSIDSDTNGSTFPSQEVDAPMHTPPAAAAAPTPLTPCPAGIPWAASFLLDFVHQCLNNLTSMHATCAAIQTETKAAEMACAIFRRCYLARDPQERAALLRERVLAASLLSAALWLAIKFEANRTATPDANLMGRISGVPAGLLRHQERQILADLKWDLVSCAREACAIGPPDLTDAVAREQQLQLAVLAAPPAAAILPAAALGASESWTVSALMEPGFRSRSSDTLALAALLTGAEANGARRHSSRLLCTNLLGQVPC